MSRTAVLIRTHHVDDALRAFAGRLRAGSAFDVFVVADETRGALDFGDIPKISLTSSTLASLGLCVGAPDLLWRCGDYGFYAARRAAPGYDAFWMIEPDVRLNAEQPCDILARFPGPEEVDFLAGRLRLAGADWDWAALMEPGAGPVWRCLFSLVRLSAPAIDLLHDARQGLTARHLSQGADPAAWPNDEVFVASTLARSGLVCRDLNDFGPVYDDAGFSFWFPVSERELQASGLDGWIYHPVLSGQAYFIKLCRLAVRHGALDGLAQIVEQMIGLEWTEEEARGHRRAIDFLKVQHAIATAPPPLAAE
ncbi:MAG TPA: hypothetical protein VIJ94_05495 [Caulobacteraceae bacterium]